MIDRIVDGRTDLVFELLSEGIPANSTDNKGVPLINWCAYYGDVSAIRFLLANGESLGENFDLNGAAFHGHWHLCQFLIESGSDVDCPLPETGETPLHEATIETIQLLLDAVATKDARDMNGDTPLTCASWHLRPDAILRKLCYGDYSLHPEQNSLSGHGNGWGAMDSHLLGKPHKNSHPE